MPHISIRRAGFVEAVSIVAPHEQVTVEFTNSGWISCFILVEPAINQGTRLHVSVCEYPIQNLLFRISANIWCDLYRYLR